MMPFSELDQVCNEHLGDDFIVRRSGHSLTLCVDEHYEDADFGGATMKETTHTAELLSLDFGQVVPGDILEGGAMTFKVLRDDPGPHGTRLLLLRELVT